MRTFFQRLIFFLVIIMTSSALVAQEQAIIVPDLTGMSVPRAAAELNRLGIRIGNQTDQSWSEDQGLPEGSISGQSIAAGTSVDPGSAVDVTVLRSPNLRLIYDDNDLTVVNLHDKSVDLTGAVFKTEDGNAAAFDATQLTGNLTGTQCVQLWSVSRNGPKEVDGCSFIQNWMSTTRADTHFWISTGGATRFAVTQDGAVRTTCATAGPRTQEQPLTCDFYLPSGGQGGDVAEFVYFVYTTEQFLALNTAPDEWMRLNKTVIHNTNPVNQRLGTAFKIGDAALFGNPEIVADIKQLAPQQCLLFKHDDVSNDPLPQPCDIIAQLDLPADQRFWTTAFEIESKGGERFTCPAAVEGKRTICAMPR